MLRLGYAAGIAMAVCDVTAALMLYILLRRVEKNLAMREMVLRLVMAAVPALSALNQYQELLVLG